MSFSLEDIIHPLGLTLLDSLWQGAIVLLVCGGLLWLLRHKASRIRYYVVLSCLFALPVLAIITFFAYYQPAANYEASSIEIIAYSMPDTLITSDSPMPQLSLMDQWHQWAKANAGYICLFWLIGFLLFAVRLTGGFYLVHRFKAQANIPVNSYWVEQVSVMSTKLKLKVSVRLLQSAKATSPMVLGYLKPCIIFPIGLIQGLPTDQIEAILLHELAHIKRHDYLLNILVSTLQLFFFYHPAYWWLQSQLDSEREYSCDDLVINQTGNQLSLIKALTAVREFQLTSYTPSMAFAGQKNQLLKRVERIMKKKTRTNWLGGLISMSVLLLSFSLMSYQSRQNTSKTVTTTEGQVTDSLSFISQNFELPAYAEDSISSASLQMLQAGPITLQQATMNLIDPKKSGLHIVTDDQDNLILLKKHGKKVEGKELEIYLQAYKNLKQYVLKQQVILKNQETIKDEYDDQLRQNRLPQFVEEEVDSKSAEVQAEVKKLIALRTRIDAYDIETQVLRRRLELIKSTTQNNEALTESLKNLDEALIEKKSLVATMKTMMERISAINNDPLDIRFKRRVEYIADLEVRTYELSKYIDRLKAEQKQLMNQKQMRQVQDGERVQLDKEHQAKVEASFKKELSKQLRILDKRLAEADTVTYDYTGTKVIMKNIESLIAQLSASQNGNSEILQKQFDYMILIQTLLNQVETRELPHRKRLNQILSENANEKMLKLLEESRIANEKIIQENRTQLSSLNTQDQQVKEVQELKKKIQAQLEILREKAVTNGHYTYSEHDKTQDHLVSTISMASAVADRPLIVVDGTVQEAWTYIDLNQIDENRIIKSLTVQSADKVTDPAYTSLMSDRNALILIQTASGGKKFKRPKFYEGQMKILSAEEVVQQKQKLFTKKAVEKLQLEGLLEKDWSSFSISQDQFFIDGKEQSKKTHRKYLKLYKQMVGKSFPPVALVWIND